MGGGRAGQGRSPTYLARRWGRAGYLPTWPGAGVRSPTWLGVGQVGHLTTYLTGGRTGQVTYLAGWGGEGRTPFPTLNRMTDAC